MTAELECREVECADCRQNWLAMPGEIEASFCPSCSARHWREQQAAQKARRAALKASSR